MNEDLSWSDATRKLVIVLGADHGDGTALIEELRGVLAASPGIDSIRVGLPVEGPTGQVGGFVEAWGEGAALRGLRSEISTGSTYGAYLVDALEQKGVDRAPTDSESVKAVGVLVPYAEHDPDSARRMWDEHAPLAVQIHFGMSSYVRNWVAEALPHSPDFFGFAMLRFPSARSIEEEYFLAPAAENRQRIRSDVARFVGLAIRVDVHETLLSRD